MRQGKPMKKKLALLFLLAVFSVASSGGRKARKRKQNLNIRGEDVAS